jgi:hypothetical protein
MRASILRDRSQLLVLLVAALILVTRAVLMAGALSESYDDEFHLVRGARFFLGTLRAMAQTDPPLGEALTALPMVLTNDNPRWSGTLYDHSSPPERVLLLVAIWRSLLFLPVVGIAFAWCRRLYGSAAGWLAAVLLLIEPTFAAHIPLAALDALGVAGVVVASWLLWRAFEAPSPGRFAAAATATAAALLIKHTAILLPMVAVGYAALFWIARPRADGAAWRAIARSLPARVAWLAAGAVATAFALWALLLFDYGPPDLPPAWQQAPTAITRALDRPIPAGLYAGSVLQAEWHAGLGHSAFLLGEKSRAGWWYYFPVVLFYKMPIGIALVFAVALASLAWARPHRDEWGLALPAALWTALMLGTHINIGLRHFLPAYVFLLMLAARALAPVDRAGRAPRAAAVTAWSGCLVAALHVLAWHPDYVAYVNWPRDRVWMQISDSNLDWGQGLKEVRDWIDRHPAGDGRPIYLLYFGDPNSPRRVAHYLGDRVVPLWRQAPLPEEGLLIASPVWVAGPFDAGDRYAALRNMTPIDTIGGALLVYDLRRAGEPVGRSE